MKQCALCVMADYNTFHSDPHFDSAPKSQHAWLFSVYCQGEQPKIKMCNHFPIIKKQENRYKFGAVPHIVDFGRFVTLLSYGKAVFLHVCFCFRLQLRGKKKNVLSDEQVTVSQPKH